MKIKVAHYVEEKEPVYSVNVAVWTASAWVLSNTTVSAELQKRAWAGSGINPASPNHNMKLFVKGHPEWAYQAKIFRGDWVERV